MTERTELALRDFQARLAERLKDASSGSDASVRLGLAIGDGRWLVDLAEAGEIVPVPATITPVPHTRDWLRGIVSVRGTLYAVTDLSRFEGGAPTPMGKASRLLSVAGRLEFNAALLVTRMFGLHNLSAMTPVAPDPDTDAAFAWHGPLWQDAEGRQWRELRLAPLLADPRFLQVERAQPVA